MKKINYYYNGDGLNNKYCSKCARLLGIAKNYLEVKENLFRASRFKAKARPVARWLLDWWLETRKAFIQDEDQRAASKNLPKITAAVLAEGTGVPSRRTS